MMQELDQTEGAFIKRPLIIGLTGGVASGKSTVSRYLNERHDLPIIDTDVIARELVQAGGQTLCEVVEHFGEHILDGQGQLNRRLLRDMISQNSEQRAWLNALMHPRIYAEVVNQIEQLKRERPPYLLIVIPLLSTNSPYLKLLNAVWLVDCEMNQQKKRLITRDQMSEAKAQQLIEAQPSRAERLKLATHIILNDQDTEWLIKQAETLYQNLINLQPSKGS
jgi:dephospho-CoA kinase